MPLDCTRYARDEDVAFFQRELASFVPDRVYDAHCHLDAPGSGQPLVKDFEEGVDHAGYLRMLDCMMPGRDIAPNFHWIRRYCETFPNMKLILAHSARGFQPAHNLEGLPKLEGLENLYFDCSVNCEPIAHQSIIRMFGHRKLMYGSDFPVSHLRGRSLGAADSFLWLYGDTPVWGERHGRVDPVLVGLEQLRSLKWACWSERLTDSQVEDVFWNNAAALFNVTTD